MNMGKRLGGYMHIIKSSFKQFLFNIFIFFISYFTSAQAAEIIELRVTGGEFAMGPFTSAGAVPYSFTGNYNLITDFPTTIGWDVDVTQTSAADGAVVAFDFGTPFVNTFITDCDPQVSDDCVNNPHTPTNGTVNGANSIISNGDSIVVDINGMYANWNGINFNQGGVTGDGTAYPGTAFEFDYVSKVSNVNENTFDYSMTWTSLIVGGPFNGQTGAWTFTGSGVIATTSNEPKTDPGLVLTPNNFGTITVPAAEMGSIFPLPSGFEPCSTCWDFMVTGLAVDGDTARVVIPLASPIPTDFDILKYDVNTLTWNPYDTSNGDVVSSSTLVGGECPDTGDPAYVSPPQAGDFCLQLTSADGQANDGDHIANSMLLDPAGIFTTEGGGEGPVGPELTKMNDNSACSLSNISAGPAKATDWWLLASFIAWLGWRRQKLLKY